MDIDKSAAKSNTTASPKLRKNKRLEARWGQKYYAMVSEAVFMQRGTPFIPADPPLSIRQETDDVQPLHACKQCGDCFHFLSSLEAHNSRRSWILGYWCQNCFLTDCSHMQSGQPPCFDCQKINRQRKTYLKAKGLRKGRKMACIKIFYNQCQFYSHLEGHRINIVDMADIMLMPVPLEVEKERYGELERVCETLLEHMFLTRTHIMDWLKSNKLGDKWWSVLKLGNENEENSLARMLKLTGVPHGGKKLEKHFVKPPKATSTDGKSPSTAPPSGSSSVPQAKSSNFSSSISETIEAVIAQSAYSDAEPLTKTKNFESKDSETKNSEINNKNSETKDSQSRPSSSETIRGRPQPREPRNNPCTTADIAFVDCGSVAKTYLTQIALPQKHRPSIISNGTARRVNAVNVGAAKTESHVLSKVPCNPLKMKETSRNIASAKPPSTKSIINQGSSFEPMITVKKFAYEHLKDEQPIVTGNNQQNSTSKWNNKKGKGTGKYTIVPSARVTGPKTLLPPPSNEVTKSMDKVLIKKVVTQNSIPTSGPRILTVHGPKNADLSQIIGQLPANVINGRKVVFIGQDPERVGLISKSDTLSNLGMIKIQSESEKPKLIQTVPTEVAPLPASHDTTSEQSNKIFQKPGKTNVSTDQTRPKIQQLFLEGNIICQNGKKFVIRQTRKPSSGAGAESESTHNNLNNLKLPTISKRVTLSSFLSKAQDPITSYVPIAAKPLETGVNKIPSLSLIPILPWNPSSSSSSSSSSTSPSSSSSLSPPLTCVDTLRVIKPKDHAKENGKDIKKVDKSPCVINPPESNILASTSLAALLLRNVHKFDAVEYYSVDRAVAGWLYIDLTKGKPKPPDVNGGLSWSEVCIKYKQQVAENMKYHGKKKSEELIEHLKEVHSEYSRIIGATDDKKISENLEAIKELEKLENEISFRSKQGLVPSDDDINGILLGFQETTEETICSVCNKPEKSKSLITESLKRPGKNAGYCSCNEYICHICHVFQGSMSRLISHLNFHANREPFSCPECLKKFTSHIHLEIHVWTACFHLLARRWFKCKICNVEGFLDVESLTKHFLLAHSKVKIACPICGILLKSRTAFDAHCEGAHPSLKNPVPVNFAECEVGKYLVRLEQYKAHLDEHVGVMKKLYYECPLCSFIAEESARGSKSIKAHLHNSHSKRLWELVSPECLPAVKLSGHSDRSKSPLQSEKTNSIQVQTIQAQNTTCKSQDEDSLVVSDQIPNSSESVKKDTDPLVSESIANNFQTDNPKSDNQTLRGGVESNVWSVNVDQSKSAQDEESKSNSSSGVVTQVEKAVGNRNNVIAEYSLSPQIFDVRSVTPDSYAELESLTKEPIGGKSRSGQEGALQLVSTVPKARISENSGRVKPSDRSFDHTVFTQTNVTKSESKDSVIVKLGEKLLPMKVPQVIVINQAASNISLPDVFQSTMITGSNTFIKLQDSNSNKKPGINLVGISAESSNKNSDKSKTNEQSVPVIETVFTLAQPDASRECKNAGDIDTSEPVVEEVEKSLDDKRAMESVSLPSLKNNSILKTLINVTKPSGRVPNDSEMKSHDESLQRNANASASDKKNMLDSLPPRDMSVPPPLARIPRLIEASRLKVPLEEKYESVNVRLSEIKTPVKLKRRPKRPWRIALNAPIGGTECHTNYRCHLCSELINTSWPVTQRHFIKKHSEDYKLSILTPRLSRLSSEFVDGGYKEAFGSKKRKFDGNVAGYKRRRRWSPKKHVEKYPLDLGLCVEQESVQDGEGKFMCKKCDKRCDDILSLRTHIGNNHRIKDHYLVCLDCGENFVVEPSLQMHLKVFHNIKDPSNYLKQNTAYAKEFTEIGESEPNTGIANQCHVCMAVFEDKSAVDKHLRVHGMAFLNRKRIEARIAARNPEKKIKIDKPNDSSTLPNSKTANTKNLDIVEMKPRGGQTVHERPCQEKSVK